MNTEPLEQITRRIQLIPDRYRVFTDGAEEAARIHKIPADLLPSLLDLGLPCRASGTGYRFDRTDLENIALSLRLRCPRYVAMQWWARSLRTLTADQDIEFSLRIAAICPYPGHLGQCAFSVSPYLEQAVTPGTLTGPAAGVVTAQVALPTQTFTFDGAYAELFDRLADLSLHIFPESVPVASWPAYQTGLADCRVAARLLVQAAAEAGLVARPASGFFMASPFPMRHVWVEFDIAGSWQRADPFLMQSLARWGIVDGTQWPIYRSPPGLLWKLRASDAIGTALVHHAGQESPSSCVIRKGVMRAASQAGGQEPARPPGQRPVSTLKE